VHVPRHLLATPLVELNRHMHSTLSRIRFVSIRTRHLPTPAPAVFLLFDLLPDLLPHLSTSLLAVLLQRTLASHEGKHARAMVSAALDAACRTLAKRVPNLEGRGGAAGNGGVSVVSVGLWILGWSAVIRGRLVQWSCSLCFRIFVYHHSFIRSSLVVAVHFKRCTPQR
jgi:hypothetical protein